MLKDIISKISCALAENGAENIYSAFDNIPAAYKGRELFTVVGIESFECNTPIYSQYAVFIPFKAEVCVNIAAPPDCSAERLYDYFDKHILPAFEDISSLTCSLKKLVIKKESTLGKLVLRVNFSASGISRAERSAS